MLAIGFLNQLVESDTVTLYHVTWTTNVPGIMRHGLIPNHNPNKWVLDTASRRSKGVTFLCSKQRMEYWNMTYNDGWVAAPESSSKLTWLRVRIPKSWCTPDHATGEAYGGDFRCTRTIPPDCITGLAELFADREFSEAWEITT